MLFHCKLYMQLNICSGQKEYYSGCNQWNMGRCKDVRPQNLAATTLRGLLAWISMRQSVAPWTINVFFVDFHQNVRSSLSEILQKSVHPNAKLIIISVLIIMVIFGSRCLYLAFGSHRSHRGSDRWRPIERLVQLSCYQPLDSGCTVPRTPCSSKKVSETQMIAGPQLCLFDIVLTLPFSPSPPFSPQ